MSYQIFSSHQKMLVASAFCRSRERLALYFVHCNFCRIQRRRASAAVAAGITDELMDMRHIVRLIDQAEEAPEKRGPYKKKAKQEKVLSKPLVVLGTARQYGETRRAIDIAFPNGSFVLANLCDRDIAGYDYTHTNATDDFLAVVEDMLAAQVIVFATPVYWYAMSGTLKAFFDRLTDLLETAKDKGRALAGKEVWLLATGTDATLPDGFEVPFRRTADYFAMQYREASYLYTGHDPEHRRSSEETVLRFGRAILDVSTPN